MIELQTKLEVFGEFLSCSGLSLWQFDADMRLISATSENAEQLDTLMRTSGSLESIGRYCAANSAPGFNADRAAMVTLAVPRHAGDALTGVYIIGPAFTSPFSERALSESLSGLRLPIQSVQNALKLLGSVPVIQHTLLLQYGRMLHRIVSGELLELADIQMIAPPESAEKKLTRAQEDLDHERPDGGSVYAMECEIFKAVEEGNTAYTHPDGVYQLTPGVLSRKDPVRSAKNEVVSCVTLITRAAIRGGMPEASAYALADYYICMMEDADNIAQVYQYSQDAFRDFTERVRKYKLSGGRSKEVQACVSFLELHLNRRVTLRELSHAVGYNSNYLSTKFSREMGVSISDYLTALKIERAKVLLQNTSKSLQDVCEDLGLSSTSYFCALFKRETGKTPMAYKNQAGDPD